MNITFSNKLAFDCWHGMTQTQAHHEPLCKFLTRFLMSNWLGGTPNAEDIPARDSATDREPRPDWSNIAGRITEMTISVNPNDCYCDNETGLWMTCEFGWVVYAYSVNEYGDVDREKCTFVINGGFINHGTHDEPRWSNHT